MNNYGIACGDVISKIFCKDAQCAPAGDTDLSEQLNAEHHNSE